MYKCLWSCERWIRMKIPNLLGICFQLFLTKLVNNWLTTCATFILLWSGIILSSGHRWCNQWNWKTCLYERSVQINPKSILARHIVWRVGRVSVECRSSIGQDVADSFQFETETLLWVPFQVLKAHQDNQVHEVIAVTQDHQVYPVVVAVQECLAKTDLLEGEVLEGNQERAPMLMLLRLKTFWKYWRHTVQRI